MSIFLCVKLIVYVFVLYCFEHFFLKIGRVYSQVVNIEIHPWCETRDKRFFVLIDICELIHLSESFIFDVFICFKVKLEHSKPK